MAPTRIPRGPSKTRTTPTSISVERYTRRARRLHALTYVLTALLAGTGLWLLAGREGDPSPLARLVGYSDIEIHEVSGWALAALGVAAMLFGARGARTMLVESLSFRRGELQWLRRWPSAAFTGRFARHEGAFDPGQRLANIVMVGGLAVLVGSGIGLVLLSGGELFAVLLRVHKLATYVVFPVIVGHVVVATGVLRGYRGVWRSMHGRGRVELEVARRLWPVWAERHTSARR